MPSPFSSTRILAHRNTQANLAHMAQLTGPTPSIGRHISVFWIVYGLISSIIGIGTPLKKIVSNTQGQELYAYAEVETFIGFSATIAAYLIRVDSFGSETLRHRITGLYHILLVNLTNTRAGTVNLSMTRFYPSLLEDLVLTFLVLKTHYPALPGHEWFINRSSASKAVTLCFIQYPSMRHFSPAYDRMIIWIDQLGQETYPSDLGLHGQIGPAQINKDNEILSHLMQIWRIPLIEQWYKRQLRNKIRQLQDAQTRRNHRLFRTQEIQEKDIQQATGKDDSLPHLETIVEVEEGYE